MDKDKCPIDVVPMSTWIQTDGKLCKPCTLGIIVQWYIIAFEEDDKESLGYDLQELVMHDGNPVEICEMLDTLKNKTVGELRDRLMGFDCLIQQNE